MLTKFIRQLPCLFIAAIVSLNVAAQAITTPRTPSPAAVVTQTIGISSVTVNYSRPSVKGREVWGNLVPYGWNVQGFGTGNSAPWRAGANENTIFEIDNDVKVEGQYLPKGKYGLFVAYDPVESIVIFSKSSDAWGSFFL